MLCLRITYAALTRWRDIMHHQCKSFQSSAICTLSSVLCTLKNFTSVCVVQGAKNPRVDKARSSHGISREHE